MRAALLVLLAGCQVVFAPHLGDAAGGDGGDASPDLEDAAGDGFTPPVLVDLGVPLGDGDWITDPALTQDETQLAFRLVTATASDILIARDKISVTAFGASDRPAVSLPEQYEEVPELSAAGDRLYFAFSAQSGELTDIAIGWRSEPTATDWQLDIAPTGLNTARTYDAPGGPSADGTHMIVRRSTSRSDAALIELELHEDPAGWVEVPDTTATLDAFERPNNAQLSPDGLRVAFSAYLDGTSDLFVATRPALGEPFGVADRVEGLSTADYHETDPWLSADGNRIYFSRATLDGVPGPDWRIWYSERTPP